MASCATPRGAAAPQSRPIEERCDSAWDGALFGILPGVLVSWIYNGSANPDTVTVAEASFVGGLLGAVLGAVWDTQICNPLPEGDEGTEKSEAPS